MKKFQGILLGLLPWLLCLSQRGDAGLASTWDYCQCIFNEWREWSQCDSTCFGQRERSRSVNLTQHPGCDEFTDCASGDMGWDYDTCNKICHNGGALSSSGYSCNCVTGYTGTCCSTRINCGSVDDIAHGHVSCSNSYYAGTCTYTCDQYYNLTGGGTERTCQLDSVWSGQKPYCAYVNHCASQPCLNGGQCTDLLDDYSCTCEQGWSGERCETDVQPPVMFNCSSSFKVNATEMTHHVDWEPPIFEDPMGTTIDVVANYPSPGFTFPWDDFTVQYVANKASNGLQTECQFTIGVRPTPCEELNIPANGARVCNGWRRDFGLYCLVACQSGYTIDNSLYSYSTMYVCGASGQWIASDPAPDCNIQMVDTADIIQIQPEYTIYSYNSSCNDPTAKTQLQDMYIDTIKGDNSFKEICSMYPDECIPQNVDVDC